MEQEKNIAFNESPEKKGLTIEKLRTLKGYEKTSDEEASRIVLSIKKLAVLLIEHLIVKKKQDVKQAEAKIITLVPEKQVELKKSA